MIPIGSLFEIEKGELQSTKCTPGKYDFITAAEDWKTHNEYSHECEALIFAAAASGSLGRTHYVDGKFTTSDLCYILTPKDAEKFPLNLSFYHFVFNSLRSAIVKATKSGTSKESINQTNFNKYEIPYFDIELQELWIEKLKGTLGKKDLLDAELTHQQSSLKKLRQQILQEAIEGKLTVDWRAKNPDVEPASELLKRIAAEKAQLVKDQIIKPPKKFQPISDKEKPFELPAEWAWSRIGFITSISSGKGFTKSEYSKDGVRLFQIANVSFEKASWESKVFLPMSYLKKYPALELHEGDIVMALNRPLLGKRLKVACLNSNDVPSILYQRVGRFDMYAESQKNWLYLYLTAPEFSNWLYEQIKGVNIPFVNQTKVYTHLIPLPPQKEQDVIIEKIIKLLNICDQLETQINQNQTHAEQLMQAVLREAFSHNTMTSEVVHA
jgi:type I restriction enzyme, S subunit